MIGEKLRKIRKLRGLTQGELGIKCNFQESSADVRIRQYESDKKAPKRTLRKEIADALDIDPESLYVEPISDFKTMVHTILNIEDYTPIIPISINGTWYIKFSETDYQNQAFLNTWAILKEKYQDNNEYYLKKQSFFKNSAFNKKIKEMQIATLLQKQQQLQAEIEQLSQEILEEK